MTLILLKSIKYKKDGFDLRGSFRPIADVKNKVKRRPQRTQLNTPQSIFIQINNFVVLIRELERSVHSHSCDYL